jgi:SNF2 family DNA or RNA helicase
MRKAPSRLSPQQWKPHGYQKKALKHLVENGAAALFLDPGMGKTSVTLAAFEWLRRRKVANRMLVIAPLRVCHLVWPAEVKEWKDFQHLKVAVLHGKNKEELLQSDADIFVINPEGLEWLIFGGKGRSFSSRRWRDLGIDTLVIDELTKFKHSKGVRFKALKTVLETFSRRWGLTGTPAPNGLLDLFGQMYVLDLGNALGRFITHYRMRYFVNPDGQGWKWVLQHGAAELIYERIKPLALRMSAEDYLELPEIVPLKIRVDLPGPVRKLYDQLEEDALAQLEERTITAANAAAVSTKLRQIANGALYVDDDVAALVKGSRRSVMQLHEAKLDAVEELLDELQGQPLFLAYEFNHDLEALQRRFKDVPVIGGKGGLAADKKIEAAWNAGELPLLLGQPASVGHGLNLQKGNAAHVGWFSMFWDLELYDQFLRRVRRQGNKAARVFNYHFMANDTMDDTIYHVQRSKERGQNALFEALKLRRR